MYYVVNWICENVPLLGDPEAFLEGGVSDLEDPVVRWLCPCLSSSQRKVVRATRTEDLQCHASSKKHTQCKGRCVLVVSNYELEVTHWGWGWGFGGGVGVASVGFKLPHRQWHPPHTLPLLPP